VSKLVRREFVGNRIILLLLFLVPFLIPLGIVYLLEGTVSVEAGIENPEEFLEAFREGRIGK
jgi:hypothetical protein